MRRHTLLRDYEIPGSNPVLQISFPALPLRCSEIRRWMHKKLLHTTPGLCCNYTLYTCCMKGTLSVYTYSDTGNIFMDLTLCYTYLSRFANSVKVEMMRRIVIDTHVCYVHTHETPEGVIRRVRRDSMCCSSRAGAAAPTLSHSEVPWFFNADSCAENEVPSLWIVVLVAYP